MRPVTLLISLLLPAIFVMPTFAALPMRPYSGIGVVRINTTGLTDNLPLYDEPGLVRNGILKPTAIQELTSWLFGLDNGLYLLVTARKGDWLRVASDDSGREAWLQAPQRWSYTPWELFLKGKLIAFLRNAPKKLQLVHTTPGTVTGIPLATSTPMKVIMVHGDWCYVLFDKTNAGWIRWRDHDGRLIVGLAQISSTQSR